MSLVNSMLMMGGLVMQLKTNVFADGRALIKSLSAAARCVRAIVFALVAVFVCRAEAAFLTYASRTEFNAAHPQLPLEDFETGAEGNRFGFFGSGLNSLTENDVFGRGEILPGIEFASTLGDAYLPEWHLFAAGPAAEPQATSTILGQTFFAESLNIDFAPSVSAVGLDVSVIAAATRPVNVVATVFGPEGWIGEFGLAVGGLDQPAFFGLFSDVPIVRLNLADAEGAYAEAVDNVAFGATVSKVPEPSVLSIVILTGLGYVIRSWRIVAV